MAEEKITFEDEVKKRFGARIKTIQFMDINLYSDDSGRTFGTVEFNFIPEEK